MHSLKWYKLLRVLKGIILKWALTFLIPTKVLCKVREINILVCNWELIQAAQPVWARSVKPWEWTSSLFWPPATTIHSYLWHTVRKQVTAYRGPYALLCSWFYDHTVKPVLKGPYIKRNFILNGNIFKTLDYHSITCLKGNLASAEKISGPLRFRLRQVLLYYYN
jgi:hypothetical protein